jgi:hypothetical protein
VVFGFLLGSKKQMDEYTEKSCGVLIKIILVEIDFSRTFLNKNIQEERKSRKGEILTNCLIKFNCFFNTNANLCLLSNDVSVTIAYV